MATTKNVSSDLFFQKVAGRKDRAKYISDVINSSGDLSELYDTDAIVKSLITLFLINSETYFMDRKFGLGLYKYIWEPADETTKARILSEVQTAILKYESRANITTDIVFFNNKKGFRIDLTVDYKGVKKQTSINLDESLLTTVT